MGLTRKDNMLNPRWMAEPLPDGPYQGMKAADYLEAVKDEYYAAHGWDRETSLPTRRKFDELGLTDVAAVLSQEGCLAK